MNTSSNSSGDGQKNNVSELAHLLKVCEARAQAGIPMLNSEAFARLVMCPSFYRLLSHSCANLPEGVDTQERLAVK